MHKHLKRLLKESEILNEKIKGHYTDETYSLDDRIALLELTGETRSTLQPLKSLKKFRNLNRDTLMSLVLPDHRYATVDIRYIIETLEDCITVANDLDTLLSHTEMFESIYRDKKGVPFRDKDIIDVKEECLELGMKAFIFDW